MGVWFVILIAFDNVCSHEFDCGSPSAQLPVVTRIVDVPLIVSCSQRLAQVKTFMKGSCDRYSSFSVSC